MKKYSEDDKGHFQKTCKAVHDRIIGKMKYERVFLIPAEAFIKDVKQEDSI